VCSQRDPETNSAGGKFLGIPPAPETVERQSRRPTRRMAMMELPEGLVRMLGHACTPCATLSPVEHHPVCSRGQGPVAGVVSGIECYGSYEPKGRGTYTAPAAVRRASLWPLGSSSSGGGRLEAAAAAAAAGVDSEKDHPNNFGGH